jgi:hypothetical protein
MLAVEGIEAPFAIDPLSAKRGKHLTGQFMKAAANELTEAQGEQIFIEALGPANYSRMAGYYVDVVKPLETHESGAVLAISDPVLTFGPAGIVSGDPALSVAELIDSGYMFNPRDRHPEEPFIEGEPIRQQEGEALCLCAFYWQTIVGIEGVNAFLDAGEGTLGSVKALTLLQIRLGLWMPETSRALATANSMQEDGSSPTPGMQTSSALDRLPANKRGFLNRKGRRATAHPR